MGNGTNIQGAAAASVVIVATLAAAPAVADGNPMSAHSEIGDGALGGTTGAVTVNQAAGDGNTQANAGAVAAGGAEATARTSQWAQVTTRRGEVRARIGGGAFAGASGWIAVNQSAGQGNAQANSIAVGVDGSPLGDDRLARVEVSQQQRTGSGEGTDAGAQAAIDDTAFAGTSGIVQINQSAGSGNATGNRFELRVDGAVDR